MLNNLADQTDADAFGYGSIDDGFFARASARVRAYATSRGCSVDAGTFTVTGRGPVIQLPNRPVREITTVSDVGYPDDPVELNTTTWVLRAGGLLEVPAFGGNLEVTYEGGLTVLSDGLIEFICGLASRMANTSAPAAAGVQQETGGSESVTFGFDAYSGISDLTKGELRTLGRFFPTIPGVVLLR